MKPFIVFEGPEGSGKTTQIILLKKYLDNLGLRVLTTKQPGGDDPLCVELREVLLRNRNNSVSARTELLLFEADRAQHVDFVLIPALTSPEYDVVICSRYEASSFAYQSVARNVCSKEEFEFINSFATRKLEPSYSVFLDIDPLLGKKRKLGQKSLDGIESEDISFYRAVRKGFYEYFENIDSNKWMRIDGQASEEAVHQLIVENITNFFLTHNTKPLV